MYKYLYLSFFVGHVTRYLDYVQLLSLAIHSYINLYNECQSFQLIILVYVHLNSSVTFLALVFLVVHKFLLGLIKHRPFLNSVTPFLLNHIMYIGVSISWILNIWYMCVNYGSTHFAFYCHKINFPRLHATPSSTSLIHSTQSLKHSTQSSQLLLACDCIFFRGIPYS